MRDDEGCQGNPPCQPASAYFSPLALAINTASPGELPDQMQLPSPGPLCRPPRSAAPLRTSPEPFLRASFSLRASPRAHYRRPSQTNPLAFPCSPRPSSRDSLLRLSSGVFSSIALYLFTLLFPPSMNLSRKSHFMQHRVLEALLNLFIYELSLVSALVR